MENKTVFVITANTYTESYGAEISLFLVTEQKQKAYEKVVELKSKGFYPTLHTVHLNEDVDVYLGGYIE